MSYLPSFQNTSRMLNLSVEISELLVELAVNQNLKLSPTMRRINQLRTVHSSTWIEGNTLTLDEVTAVIDGKRVVAPEREIFEVSQAFAAYEAVETMNPTSLDDLLTAHGIMMQGIAKDAGELRKVEVGVYSGPVLIHTGTPVAELRQAMEELFEWLKSSEDHPLIQGCYFHCAFEMIHPFSDGNGRTGRLWHSLINRKWKSQLAWVPVETMVARNQQAYYHVLRLSNAGDATFFIEFMLEMVRDAISEELRSGEEFSSQSGGVRNDVRNGVRKATKYPPSTPQVPPKVDDLVQSVLEALDTCELSATELMSKLGLSDRKHFRDSYLQPALEAGVIERTLPDKPSSPKQKYRRTK